MDSVSEDALVFHAGTKSKDGVTYTDGGRVLSVVGAGESLQESIRKTYQEVDKISFENKYFRTDIGAKGLMHLNE